MRKPRSENVLCLRRCTQPAVRDSQHIFDYKNTAASTLATSDHPVSIARVKKHAFIRNNCADFAGYFKKFYKLPYTSLGSVSRRHSNYVLRFENLQDDFSTVLDLLGIDAKRPLPTAHNAADYLSYYRPEVLAQARWVFGPFMERWNYDFPAEWGSHSVHWMSHVEFHAVEALRTSYCRLTGGRTAVTEWPAASFEPQTFCGTLD
jgi:hypothetical protein